MIFFVQWFLRLIVQEPFLINLCKASFSVLSYRFVFITDKVKVDSWWRFLLHCSYCLCLCDSPTKESDRHWSLMAQMSDIDSNKIVTGVRFVKKNGIIHLEIEQATALKEGKVDDSSRQWVQSQNLDPQNSTQKSLGYFKTMSYEERALDIDRLEAISGKVIYAARSVV